MSVGDRLTLIMLVTLAALNAICTAWATVLDARRPAALMRALGASSQQISSGLLAAQVLSVLPGAILGIPLGILLFKAVAGHTTAPPSAVLVAVAVLGTLLVVAGLTTVPARIGARIPAPQILQSETASSLWPMTFRVGGWPAVRPRSGLWISQAIRSRICRTRSIEVCGCRKANRATVSPSQADGGMNATWSISSWSAQRVY